MVVEVVAGLVTNSLTLLADAAHMFLDATALGLSWYSLVISDRKQDYRLSYGYHRYQVIVAFINGIMLFGLIGWIYFEAFERILAPKEMLALPALATACLGLLINIIVYRMLHVSSNSMVVRSAALHVLSDILGSVSAIAAALIVYLTGWMYADILLALVVTLILGRGAWKIVRDALHILLEGVPHQINTSKITRAVQEKVADVDNVHHLHAWGLTPEKPLLTMHAQIAENGNLERAVRQIKDLLKTEFDISHSTIQVEYGRCPDEQT
tara:strand:- start:1384 stop:2187 length:804 start_codon:yes stop_codon:yes gene_type:complete